MGGINWADRIIDQVNALITAGGGVLVHDGLILLAYICAIKILSRIAGQLWSHIGFTRHHEPPVNIGEVLIFFFQVSLVAFALNHWMTPLPGASFSLHQVPTMMAKHITDQFDVTAINQFADWMNRATAGTQKPNPLFILDCLLYLFVLGDMIVLSAAMFVVSSYGFIGVGVMTVFGPLFLPLSITKNFYGWFWAWLEQLFSYASYRVVAAAIAWVWSELYVNFLIPGIGPNFAISDWLANAVVVGMLTIGFAFTMFKIPAMTASMFRGAGGLGQSFVAAIEMGVRAAVA